ncbi:MAG: carboxypeptidase regulatory-like domain-containing protein [Deltaproteobacteria bacterium]|nr:carboxypeptidase regulatory-like domain-containing protein [Deltaproteobacteria bacterium]
MKALRLLTLVAVLLVSGLLLLPELHSQGAAGTIKGTVKLTGTPPAVKPLKKQADPYCAKNPSNDETVVVNGNGTLKNVAVRIKGPVVGAVASPTTVNVTLDQNQCMYVPRVAALGLGQKLSIKNSDPVLHNVHCYNGPQTCFNQAQMKGAKDIEKELAPGLYKMKCDVHPWMTGYVVVGENPFVAVTGGTGEFSLANVPAGTYTVEAWHELYGTQTAQVTVAAGGAATADFTFAVK